MSNYSHNTYGCGCGQPTIIVDPGQNCDGCIVAPKIIWGCDVGPEPGSTMNFNIPLLTNIKTPEGHTYTYEYYDHDQSGFNSVTISSVGNVVAVLQNKYEGRKKYRIRYKLRQDDGIQSKTGEIWVCVKNMCLTCTGDCDQLTGDCAKMSFVASSAECGLAWTQAVPSWDIDGIIFDEVPICFTGISYNSGTKVLSATLLNYGCAIGVPLSIKMRGIKGAVITSQEIKVTIVDKSIGVICPQFQIANRCTGVCEAVSIDLEVSDGQQQPDLSVS